MTRSLSSNFLKDYDTNGIVRHLRNKGCKGWGLSEELGLKFSKRDQVKSVNDASCLDCLAQCMKKDDLWWTHCFPHHRTVALPSPCLALNFCLKPAEIWEVSFLCHLR